MRELRTRLACWGLFAYGVGVLDGIVDAPPLWRMAVVAASGLAIGVWMARLFPEARRKEGTA